MNAHAEVLPAPRAGRRHPVFVVAAKEAQALRRDPRARLLAVIVVVLMLLALVAGALQAQRQHEERDAAQGADHALWNGQGAKDPHSAAHFGQWAFKPPSLLSLAEPGIDAYSGGAVWMEAHKRNELQFRPARDGGVAARMGSLSLAFVLQVVLPLVIVVLGFDAVSGERERGTLRQLLAQGVAPRVLLLGKALALGRGVAWLLAAVAIVLALLGMAVAPPGQALAAVQRALLWTAAHGLYLAGVVVLTIAVSAFAARSSGALVALLALWLLGTFVAPRLMTEAARRIVPLPSAQEFRERIADERRRTFGHDERHPAFVAYRDELLKRYGVQRVEDLPVNFRGLALRRDDEMGYAIYDRLYGELQAALRTQDRLRQAPGALLPVLALQPLSMALAGTDAAHHHHFADAAEQHRRVIQALVSEDIIRNQRHGDTGYVAEASLWSRVPPFDYRPPAAGWALQQALEALALLSGWAVLMAALLLLGARRLRPL
jgi:ABC-2 type transport system permease protein